LETVVNFTNILGAAFELIFFWQKITKPNSKSRENLLKHIHTKKVARKMLVKLTPGLVDQRSPWLTAMKLVMLLLQLLRESEKQFSFIIIMLCG